VELNSFICTRWSNKQTSFQACWICVVRNFPNLLLVDI